MKIYFLFIIIILFNCFKNIETKDSEINSLFYYKPTEEEIVFFTYYEVLRLDGNHNFFIRLKKDFSIQVFDFDNRRLKTSLLKHDDIIKKVDDCPMAFDENINVMLKKSYFPKALYAIYKRPEELKGIIKNITIQREGKMMEIDLNKYLINYKPENLNYEPWPEIRYMLNKTRKYKLQQYAKDVIQIYEFDWY